MCSGEGITGKHLVAVLPLLRQLRDDLRAVVHTGYAQDAQIGLVWFKGMLQDAVLRRKPNGGLRLVA
jgi:hypothetical protein